MITQGQGYELYVSWYTDDQVNAVSYAEDVVGEAVSRFKEVCSQDGLVIGWLPLPDYTPVALVPIVATEGSCQPVVSEGTNFLYSTDKPYPFSAARYRFLEKLSENLSADDMDNVQNAVENTAM